MDRTWIWWGGLLFFECEFEVTMTVVIFLIVWGRFLLVVIIASHCILAQLSMPPHGICTCYEIAKAAGTNEAQVVVHGLQVIYHCSLILAFLLHHGQKVRLPHCHRASFKWMPSKPIIFGNSLGAMILKKWMSLEEDLAKWLMAQRSLLPSQSSYTSWISLPRRLAEVAICWNMLERSSSPSCSNLGKWVLK